MIFLNAYTHPDGPYQGRTFLTPIISPQPDYWANKQGYWYINEADWDHLLGVGGQELKDYAEEYLIKNGFIFSHFGKKQPIEVWTMMPEEEPNEWTLPAG